MIGDKKIVCLTLKLLLTDRLAGIEGQFADRAAHLCFTGSDAVFFLCARCGRSLGRDGLFFWTAIAGNYGSQERDGDDSDEASQ